jgi:hypothetical protein
MITNELEGVYMHPGDMLLSPTGFGSVKKLQSFITCGFWHVRDKPVQVRWTNKSSSGAIKSLCIDMNQSIIESLDSVLSYANLTVAIVLPVQMI